MYLVSAFITLPETTTQVNANTEVTVTCSINYSDSPPTIVWYKGTDLATQSATQTNLNLVLVEIIFNNIYVVLSYCYLNNLAITLTSAYFSWWIVYKLHWNNIHLIS